MGHWEVARITKIDRRTGRFEVYSQARRIYLQGCLPDLTNSQYLLGDQVRIFVKVLPYAVKIKMISKDAHWKQKND